MSSLEKYKAPIEVVTTMIVTEATNKTTPIKIHHLLARTEPIGPVQKPARKAPRTIKELMICWGPGAMFCRISMSAWHV